jgi:hypothetical protein
LRKEKKNETNEKHKWGSTLPAITYTIKNAIYQVFMKNFSAIFSKRITQNNNLAELYPPSY